MKRLFTMAVVLLMAISANAQGSKLMKSWDNYEVNTIQVGSDGTKFIKVWGYGKNVKKAMIQAKKNAVHACIFRGLPGAETAMGTPALCKDPNAFENNEDYFTSFFSDKGDFIKYINMTTDTTPSGTDMRQVKGGYKVALYIQVMYDNLRRRLEEDGIIRGLSTGF